MRGLLFATRPFVGLETNIGSLFGVKHFTAPNPTLWQRFDWPERFSTSALAH
jgi:hypothetical protein